MYLNLNEKPSHAASTHHVRISPPQPRVRRTHHARASGIPPPKSQTADVRAQPLLTLALTPHQSNTSQRSFVLRRSLARFSKLQTSLQVPQRALVAPSAAFDGLTVLGRLVSARLRAGGFVVLGWVRW